MPRLILSLIFLSPIFIPHLYGQEPGRTSRISPPLSRFIHTAPADQRNIFHLVITDPEPLRALLANNSSIRLLGSLFGPGIYRVRCSNLDLVSHLIKLDGVRYIALEAARPKEEGVIAIADIAFNRINMIHAWYPSIDGSGLTAALKEDPFDSADIDFRLRTGPLIGDRAAISTHATTMATIIGGAGNSAATGLGAARGVQLLSTAFGSLLPDTAAYSRWSISVQNHSYGTEIENFYGSEAEAYDASAIDHPSLVHVFSSGNSGDQASPDGRYAGMEGFANLTGNFKATKNTIVVGSATDDGYVAYKSSKGPAEDGRIKPDCVAYGQTGSSEASAIVSGICLLLQHAYQQQHNELPASTLIKALLLNSADDLESTEIDFSSGYGNINAVKAMQDLLAGRYFSGTVHKGEDVLFTFQVPPKIRKLKLMLAWLDPPAAAGSAKSLVNDLDLQLEDPQAVRWLPWVLNSAPSFDSLLALPSRRRDTLNPQEQVTLDNPLPGNYTLHVTASALIGASQSFFVSYDLDTADQFHWTYPAQGDHLTGGAINWLRWSDTHPGRSGQIYYSTDNGGSWTLIADRVDLSKGYYSWVTPDTFMTSQLRMMIDGQEAENVSFSISRQLSLRAGINCPDSILLEWERRQPSSYTVYGLTGKYLSPLATVSDTFFFAPTTAIQGNYFSVTPQLGNGYSGLQSQTLDLSKSNVGCYSNSFFAVVQPDRSAELTLTVGSDFQIGAVTFEKLLQAGWQRLAGSAEVAPLQYATSDRALEDGWNTYRAVITLIDGRRKYSDTSVIRYISEKTGWMAFPNPVRNGQSISLLFYKPMARQLRVYNVTGQQVAAMTISGVTPSVSLPSLPVGIYFIKIYAEGKVQGVKKILVL